ncbi:MAG: hypothetical protein ACREEM_22585, partial [Blastocatellia bacterium]
HFCNEIENRLLSTSSLLSGIQSANFEMFVATDDWSGCETFLLQAVETGGRQCGNGTATAIDEDAIPATTGKNNF